MSELLFNLEQVLKSKQHKLTVEESKAIAKCKSKALKDYCIGAIFGAGVSWIATSKFSFFNRLSISAGASAFVGLWKLGRSLDACADHILAMEGSAMQRELANIVVTRYRDDPWRMSRVSKHFYSEEVFDDSTSDKPKLRWRYRNFFTDHADNGQTTHEDSHSESRGEEYESDTQSGSHDNEPREETDLKKFNYEPKVAPVDPDVDVMDPIDCVFGYPMMEEIHDPTTKSTTSTRAHTRKERRAHRRHRIRHQQEALLNPQHT